jgi:glycosyltransferase involved in cell wall biosynthesis
MYNAVDTDHFSPGFVDGGRLDELANLNWAAPGVIRVGLPATVALWKGHEVFLEAAAQVIREQPRTRVRFYIIGGPIYSTAGSQISKSLLQAKAAALGIKQEVGFIDFQYDSANIYRALDIVVHASTRPEPFGRTIVEAMACARPVIVAQAGGAAELFTHGYDALGVPPRDTRALATAIYRLVQDGDCRSRLAANARRTAVQRFARNRLGPEILSMYQRLLRSPRLA